jgi:hypothetical protein
MSININNDKNIPIDTHACYEELASQEELYLEETEEEVVAILTSYVSPTSKSKMKTLAPKAIRIARFVVSARMNLSASITRCGLPK